MLEYSIVNMASVCASYCCVSLNRVFLLRSAVAGDLLAFNVDFFHVLVIEMYKLCIDTNL